MDKIIIFVKKNKYIIGLLFFSLFLHRYWIDFSNILTFGDWAYLPKEALMQMHNSWNTLTNFSNFSDANVQVYLFPLLLSWNFFVWLGFSYGVAVKITVLLPILFFSVLSPYILAKKISKDNFISFIASIFYSTSTYFLARQTSHLCIAFVFAFSPLIFFLFIRALELNKVRDWLFFCFLYILATFYDIRIVYILSFVLFSYLIFFHVKNIKKYFINLLFVSFLISCFSLFWLLPAIFTINSIEKVANRGVFGDSLFNLRQSFAFFDWSWTGGYLNKDFVQQPISCYFWLIPIVVFSSLLFYKKSKYKKEIVYFGFISLVGIFLTKQSDQPLPGAYKWLYDVFPGFNVFRDASKFYLITGIGYLGLLTMLLKQLKDEKSLIFKKYLFFIFCFIILLCSLLNSWPVVTSKIGTMFVPRHIPSDYLVLKDFVLKQPEYSRTFWVPTDSRWGIYFNEKPRVSDINTIQGDWEDYTSLIQKYDQLPANEQVAEIFKIDFANELFDISSIKYVVVPLQDKANDDDFFVYYGGDKNSDIRQWYISQLDQISWLKKIDIRTAELVVYENENYRPHIYLTKEPETIYKNLNFNNVDWKFINPTEYKIFLKNVKENTYFNFSEKYHPDWSLRVGKFNWFSPLVDKNYFVDNKYHFENDAKLNSFLIDPEKICASNSCEKNSDGSYDIDLTLYFKPQSYFYFGLIISGITLLGCLGYLGYDFYRLRRKLVSKEDEKNKKI